MKKLLLSTVAISGFAMIATPAMAGGVELELGGYTRIYAAYVDQDENNGEVNDFDFLKDTEIHFSGETTLDNGLTVGAHIELNVDRGETDGAEDRTALIDESYAYFSGNWGRINLGEEDGAAYLLQVAAPSADSNVDGVRTYIQSVNWDVFDSDFSDGAPSVDYDMSVAGKDTKFTYLTPVINGFQGGFSYAPDADDASDKNGIGYDDENEAGATFEVAARYEGMFNNIGFALGAGYAEQEWEDGSSDDAEEWNIGLDLNIGAFGLGIVRYELNDADDIEEEVMVYGVDYTTGAFKLGVSYYDGENTDGIEDLDVERTTIGAIYSYGPGMTLRGSLSMLEADYDGSDADATSFLIGTQIKF